MKTSVKNTLSKLGRRFYKNFMNTKFYVNINNFADFCSKKKFIFFLFKKSREEKWFNHMRPK